MTGTGTCTEIRVELGVYVLGAIAPPDRAKVVRHVASCERCREELADLAALPALLRKLPAPQVAGQAGTPELTTTLINRVTRRRRHRQWLVAAAVAILAAAATAGWTWQLMPSGPGPASAGGVLRTVRIGDVTVLTNASGFTLYWFAPDTTTASLCTGGCASRWPPVAGPAVRGAGVTGTMGTITRPDGSTQATYNGHPLYTASLDTAPGQARGDDLDVSGGIWHEVIVSGTPPPAPSRPRPGGYRY